MSLMELFMKTRRIYDKQFKLDAVNLVRSTGKSASEVARDLGIRPELVTRWKREFEQDNEKSFPGQGNPRDEEMARLKKEVADLKMERDILKKAMAIFSQPGR
jgi:transposase